MKAIELLLPAHLGGDVAAQGYQLDDFAVAALERHDANFKPLVVGAFEAGGDGSA